MTIICLMLYNQWFFKVFKRPDGSVCLCVTRRWVRHISHINICEQTLHHIWVDLRRIINNCTRNLGTENMMSASACGLHALPYQVATGVCFESRLIWFLLKTPCRYALKYTININQFFEVVPNASGKFRKLFFSFRWNFGERTTRAALSGTWKISPTTCRSTFRFRTTSSSGERWEIFTPAKISAWNFAGLNVF